jgi:hypothetical protein
MPMKTLLGLLAVVLLAGTALAGGKAKLKDIKFDGDVAYYQGEKLVIVEMRNNVSDAWVKDVETGELLLSFAGRQAPSPEGATKSNPNGMDPYWEFTWIATGDKCDFMPSLVFSKKHLVRDMLNLGLIVDGKLHDQNIRNYILVQGTPYTDRVNRTQYNR